MVLDGRDLQIYFFVIVGVTFGRPPMTTEAFLREHKSLPHMLVVTFVKGKLVRSLLRFLQKDCTQDI
jgi:hypothetical protein